MGALDVSASLSGFSPAEAGRKRESGRELPEIPLIDIAGFADHATSVVPLAQLHVTSGSSSSPDTASRRQ